MNDSVCYVVTVVALLCICLGGAATRILMEELDRTREAIKKHKKAVGEAACEYDETLYKILPEEDNS